MRHAIGSLVIALLGVGAAGSSAADDAAGDAWGANYDARSAFYEASFGKLPDDIIKLMDMMGVWPGGGLFEIPAERLGPGLSVYTTFGFSNSDMPTGARLENVSIESDDGKRASSGQGTLTRRERTPKGNGEAGYGYEMLVIAPPDEQWPMSFLDWTVHGELNYDFGFLARVEKYNGLTIERVELSGGDSVHVLIAKARPPLPASTTLPAGRMQLLVATVITEEELRWAVKHSTAELLDKLVAAGAGQVSRRDRESVVR